MGKVWNMIKKLKASFLNAMLLSEEEDEMDEQKTLEVKTPIGTLVAYASTDPLNPGIFIDLKKDGIDYALNLAGVECQIDEDTEETRLVTHVWGSGAVEDTTHDIEHVCVEEYFEED